MTASSAAEAEDGAGAAVDPDRPGPPAPPYRRRRIVVVIVVIAVLLAGGLGLRAVLSDDDEREAGPEPAVETAPLDATEVLNELRGAPCALLDERAVEGVVERTFAPGVDAGGICTYSLDDGGTGSIAVQAFGPLSEDAFAALVADGSTLEGTDPEALWLSEGAGGRALALDGVIAVELAVRLEGGEERLRTIAAELIDLVTNQVPGNELGTAPAPAAGDVAGCPFLTDDAGPLLPGAELQAITNPDVCSFRTPDGFTTVERIVAPTVALDDIRRTSGTEDDQQEWPRVDVDVADGGVWLVPPGADPSSGELYAMVGDLLVHVSISAPDLAAAQETAIALVGAVEK